MRWSALLSALMHNLALLAPNVLLSPAGGPHLLYEKPSIDVFFSYTEKVDESPKAEVSSAIPSPGPESDGAKTYLMPESEASFAPEAEHVSEPSTVQTSEAPQPPDPRPPTFVSPQPTPSIPDKRQTATEHRRTNCLKSAAPPPHQMRPPLHQSPESHQFARSPDRAERALPNSLGEDHQRDSSSGQAPLPPGSEKTWPFGRIPLLSGNDLDKHAKLPSSEQGGRSGPLSGLDMVSPSIRRTSDISRISPILSTRLSRYGAV
jgi:hypothetical protein